MSEGLAYDPPETAEPVEPAPGPPPPRQRSTRRPARGKVGTGRKPASTRRKTPPPKREATPAEAIRGILQIPATGAVMFGMRTGSVPLVADGATVLVHGPAFAEAVAEIAENDPRVMAILEKLVTFGPYSALVMVVVIMGAQIARNHNEELEPITSGFGALPPQAIIAQAGLEIPIPVSSPNGQRDGDGSPPADTN